MIRLQGPCIRHVNDDPGTWRTLWNEAVRLCCMPYCMFVERDTGARRYFELPLARCHQIFRDACSGLGVGADRPQPEHVGDSGQGPHPRPLRGGWA